MEVERDLGQPGKGIQILRNEWANQVAFQTRPLPRKNISRLPMK